VWVNYLQVFDRLFFLRVFLRPVLTFFRKLYSMTIAVHSVVARLLFESSREILLKGLQPWMKFEDQDNSIRCISEKKSAFE